MSTLGSLWSTFELLPGPFAFNRPKIMKFVVFYRLFCIFKSKGIGFLSFGGSIKPKSMILYGAAVSKQLVKAKEYVTLRL